MWKDDIDYSDTVRKSSTIILDKSDTFNQTNDELPPSVAQDTGLDYGQGRYLELEGVEDYILWQKGYLEPTKKQVNRKWELFSFQTSIYHIWKYIIERLSIYCSN